MHIAMLSPRTLRTNAAGIEQNILHVGNYLQKKGVTVDIYCTAKNPLGKITYEGLTLHEFSAFAPQESYFYSRSLFNALRSFDGEIIHCNGFNNLVSAAGVLSKKPNQKLIITMNSSGASTAFRRLLHQPLLWFYQHYQKKFDKIIFVSQWEYDHFRKHFNLPENTFTIIPNGINANEFKQVKAKKQKYMILSVGRLVKNKGMHRLIQAMPLLLQSFPQAQLHIVGEGKEKAHLEKLARTLNVSNAVVFHGNIGFNERKKLLQLFAQAHVFSLMTDFESQGIVYGEAVAAGLPIVVPKKGVMNEYVNAGVAFGVNNPDNPQEIADAIIQSFQKKRALKLKSKLIWSWEEVGQAVLNVYHQLLEQGTG